ncbi:hypothetical protein [Synechococcus sp. BDU 130192]|uniref:hypothetical protein n=1 Tax=Synechococcus sp. BDU 130192 TaxID=2042059 RepID=UPI000C088085|nr:hypothetical protein [Synechococcus sp. BDU 130192]
MARSEPDQPLLSGLSFVAADGLQLLIVKKSKLGVASWPKGIRIVEIFPHLEHVASISTLHHGLIANFGTVRWRDHDYN